MKPQVGRAKNWPVPQIATPVELAEWLRLAPGELDWFADCAGRERRVKSERLRHYRYRWTPKRAGGFRLIEAPKTRLREIQRLLLHEILDKIPPHAAAHGFRRRRSIKSFVAPHVGKSVVVRIDLRDFFTSVVQARVVAIFRTAGYPQAVAELLAGLCTNSAPSELWDNSPAANRRDLAPEPPLGRPHLPQGAPTSPAVANLCAYRLDCRLLGLAKSAEATYTRYADDLVFSGGADFARSAKRFIIHAAAIAMLEGFHVHHRKTRLMRRSVRQHAAGIVLNEKLNVRRRDYDELKAILHNCIRFGPASQNRNNLEDFAAHLRGRVEHLRTIHPGRGARLQGLFDSVEWDGKTDS